MFGLNLRKRLRRRQRRQAEIARVRAMVRPERFNLQKGMTQQHIYEELHNRVSGETTTEVIQFFKDETGEQTQEEWLKISEMFNDHEGTIPYVTHEVIDTNGKYALIEKHSYYLSGGIRRSSPDFYLSGINDEGYYFVHTLNGFSAFEPSVNKALKWANREDEGFTERLQGDILIKFIPYDDIKTKMGTFEVGKKPMSSDDRLIRMSMHNRERPPYDHTYVNPEHRTARPENDLTIEMGRHIMLIRNTAVRMSINTGTYVVVESDRIEIVHPEHKKTVREIPEGHFAVLANQRGRSSPERFD